MAIGMAVDANVVIFSRIKEEIISGKSPRVAVQTGFKRAVSTVVDSQITTLIAAVILYQIGTSAVKGFAWTLMIGIVASLCTAVVVTQLFLGLLANTKTFSNQKFYGIKADGTDGTAIKKNFVFISKRKIFYVFSAIVIIIGLAFSLVKGFNYGIDFTGGTMLQFDMGKKVETEKIDKILNKFDIKADIVYAGQNKHGIIIKTPKALKNKERNAVIAGVQKEFSLPASSVVNQGYFGPTVGKELKNNAIKAVLLAALGMLIYIRLRFKEWNFGVAALTGIVHDILWVLTFYAVFGIKIGRAHV